MKFSAGIRRIAVIAVASAGVLTLAVQPASAGQSAAGSTASMQDTSHFVGYRCFGRDVVRCAWFNVDHTRNRFRAYSRIVDVGDRRNYAVATENVRLQVWTGSYWRNLGLGRDYDRWHPTVDTAAGGLVDCRNNATYFVRSLARMRWIGHSSGSSWVTSRAVRVRC